MKEDDGENLRDKIVKLAESMGSKCQPGDIDSVFRLGKQVPNPKRARPVMVKFKTVSARHEFYNQRFNLNKQKQWDRVWINEDVTDNTRRRKEAMRSISLLCRDNQVDCKLRSDAIIIKGIKYHINDLEAIPTPFSLSDAKIRQYGSGELYFQSEYAWPSSMYPARVTVDKHHYLTAEHAWNGVMAEANNDPVAADLIRKTISPYEDGSLSRNVHHPLRRCNVRYQAFFIKM